MISRSRSCLGGGFARISRGNPIKVTAAAAASNCNIQRDFPRALTFTASFGHKQYVSTATATATATATTIAPILADNKSSRGHCYPSSFPHRRFRSALPDNDNDNDNDYTEDEVNDENRDSTTVVVTAPSASASATARATATATATAPTPPTPFLLADIGEGIAEVELLRWFVTEGQMIREFDPVCEVQSDKATVEITSRYEGTVDKLAFQASGCMIRVGEPILWIREPTNNETNEQPLNDNTAGARIQESRVASKSANSSLAAMSDDPSAPATATASTRINSELASIIKPVPQYSSNFGATRGQEEEEDEDEEDTGASRSTPVASSAKVLTSPAVRKLARDHSLDLSTVTGTGPSGRITKGDILEILKEPVSMPSTVIGDSSDKTTDAPSAGIASQLDFALREDTVVPLRGYNRIMAETMTASLKIPHMVYSDEINLNRFMRYKMEQQQQHAEKKRLIFLPLAIKAASKALEKYPWLNASFDDEKQEATLWKDHNIGIAMDTPRGLIVPVLKHCQDKTLPEIAEELKRLKDSVTCQEGPGGGLPASDLQGATFTLSNVGAIGGGGTYMSPIITPPQVAIGAMGQIQRLPRYVTVTPSGADLDPASSHQIEEAHICTVSWAADHRVVDGATVARFHQSWKEYMEDPIRLLLELR